MFFDYQSGGAFVKGETIVTGGGQNDGLTFEIDQDREGAGAGDCTWSWFDALIVKVGQGVFRMDTSFRATQDLLFLQLYITRLP